MLGGPLLALVRHGMATGRESEPDLRFPVSNRPTIVQMNSRPLYPVSSIVAPLSRRSNLVGALVSPAHPPLPRARIGSLIGFQSFNYQKAMSLSPSDLDVGMELEPDDLHQLVSPEDGMITIIGFGSLLSVSYMPPKAAAHDQPIALPDNIESTGAIGKVHLSRTRQLSDRHSGGLSARLCPLCSCVFCPRNRETRDARDLESFDRALPWGANRGHSLRGPRHPAGPGGFR